MAGTTTAVTTQAKQDFLQAKHCFNAVNTKTASGVNGAFTLTGMANVTALAVGMAVSGVNVAAGAVVASVDSTTQVTVSKAHTGTITTATITFTGDAFKLALIKVGPTGTYGAASINYSDITGNSDETTNAAGTAYTAGGIALVNATPVTSGTTAFIDFADVSWTTASFSTTACMIYNTSQRGETANRAISTHDFGGTQTVSAGTFSLVFPTPDASNAIMRIA
jgi:hypothetical protein